MNEDTDPKALASGPAQAVHSASLLSYYGLIIFFGFVSLQALDSIRISTLVIWLLQIIPLLPFAPGLHRSDKRIMLWLSLLVLLYFMHGVQVAFDPARLWLGIIETVLCVSLFGFLMLEIRLGRETGQS